MGDDCLLQITDQPFQQKLEEIDIHLEQLTAMYQNVLDKNSGKKKNEEKLKENAEINRRES